MARTKLKTAALVDHLIHLINMHEANRLIVYSPLLSDQIPRSHAANAFNVFQDASLKFEIIRHSILWDPCREYDLDKESIPTVIQLIDDPVFLQALDQQTEASFAVLLGSASFNQHRAEKKETIAPAKFGDEHRLLSYSVAIVDGLQQGINGQTMLWNRLKKIAKRNAEALWNGCCFEVLR
jgi:hypothetical protein